MRMWRKELPPLICLARAADTNLDLPRLRRAPESQCRCLFQETCLSPCFAFQTSPSQRERDFVKGPLFPQKVWVLMNRHFLLKSVQPVAQRVAPALISARFRVIHSRFPTPQQACPKHGDVSHLICVISWWYLDGSLMAAFAFGGRANKGSLCPTSTCVQLPLTLLIFLI